MRGLFPGHHDNARLEVVTLKVPGQTYSNQLFITGVKGRPGVIMCHERWGMDENTSSLAMRLTAAGYRVVLPDLFRGKYYSTVKQADSHMKKFDFPAGVRLCNAAAEFLLGEGSVRSCPKPLCRHLHYCITAPLITTPAQKARVGVIGFSMGSAIAMGALSTSNHISCGIAFYGVNDLLLDLPILKRKSVQAHFGSLDTMAGKPGMLCVCTQFAMRSYVMLIACSMCVRKSGSLGVHSSVLLRCVLAWCVRMCVCVCVCVCACTA